MTKNKKKKKIKKKEKEKEKIRKDEIKDHYGFKNLEKKVIYWDKKDNNKQTKGEIFVLVEIKLTRCFNMACLLLMKNMYRIPINNKLTKNNIFDKIISF